MNQPVTARNRTDEPVTPRRLAAAFAATPLGTLFVAWATFGRSVSPPTEWFDGPSALISLLMLLGVTYVPGSVLLPLFFWLERSGRRSWIYYVPIAAVAGVALGFLLNGPAPLRYGVALALYCAVTGATCAAVFSVILRARIKRPVAADERRDI